MVQKHIDNYKKITIEIAGGQLHQDPRRLDVCSRSRGERSSHTAIFFILSYLQTQMNIRESEMIYLIGAQGGFLERREWGAVSFS